MLPAFAKPIADARRAGKRPADLVIVSDGDYGLHRRYRDNPVVVIKPEQRPSAMDWTFLAGLDVEIATTGGHPRTLALATAILKARPDYLRVWWLDTGELIRIAWMGLVRVERERGWVCADAPH